MKKFMRIKSGGGGKSLNLKIKKFGPSKLNSKETRTQIDLE